MLFFFIFLEQTTKKSIEIFFQFYVLENKKHTQKIGKFPIDLHNRKKIPPMLRYLDDTAIDRMLEY